MSKEPKMPDFYDQRSIIADAELFASRLMQNHDSGHNWWHIDRVRRLSLYINSCENLADPFAVELAALFHDLGDHKFDDGSSDPARDIRSFAEQRGLPEEMIAELIDVNQNISFSKGSIKEKNNILKIVQDADRMDAIGAIGIARAFTYGGYKGSEIYKPKGTSVSHGIPAGSESTTIDHFYEKLLKLKDLMNTETGKRVAERRHEYMEEFLSQFYTEFNCFVSNKNIEE